MRSFPKSEYHVPFFDEFGYVRKRCQVCGEYFWTLNRHQKTCEEATPDGCAQLSFINDPPTRRSYTVQEMREAFLSFFEKRGHNRIKPYPIVARWRDDLYFTNASIIDFQPYVTNGITPPPANPLVISQPCIRFVDVDNVGPTFGRHLTTFEMGGHHAFNYPDKEIYWKDQTVRYHHAFVTDELGVTSEEVVYKEDVWSGGGNAGPDLETIVRGLEVATLVFMKFKVVNGDFVELPIRTVDTGYGIERYTWLSQGALSCFHAIYGSVLEDVLKRSGVSNVDEALLIRVAELSGAMTLKKATDRGGVREKVAKQVGVSVNELNGMLLPIENAFAVLDHTKCLAFMIAEGVVPSNLGEGYLARLMFRRTYRLLRRLAIEEDLLELIDTQIAFWSSDFPHLKGMRDNIFEILSLEQERFKRTLKRGSLLVKRLTQDLKENGVSALPTETLIDLYDSHGLPPEVVKETAERLNLSVKVPETFYTEVAEKHIQAPPRREAEKIEGLDALILDLPQTQMLYYEDAYLTEFETRVLRVLNDKYVVLAKTAFYPEGGGQLADRGYLKFDGVQSEVVDVQKLRNVIVHVMDGPTPKSDSTVTGIINWQRRYSLMKHHTGTHVLMGAARRVLGRHVWQAGAKKEVERARLDISHFQRLALDEIHELERLANQAIEEKIPVETIWLPREAAEKQYGFRLYQGGVVPGREIRVVKSGGWEVEACGGTHVKNTGEIGFLKIVHTERIQDGVERMIFSAGLPALKTIQENEKSLVKLSDALNAPRDKLVEAAVRLVKEWKEVRREKRRLMKEIVAKDIAKVQNANGEMTFQPINGVRFATQRFIEVDIERMIKTASRLVKEDPKVVAFFYGISGRTARVVIMAGREALGLGVDSSEIAEAAAAVLGGGGSGRSDFAQGGGPSVEKVPTALATAEGIIQKQILEASKG